MPDAPDLARILDALPVYVLGLDPGDRVTYMSRGVPDARGVSGAGLPAVFPEAHADALDRLEQLVHAARASATRQTIGPVPMSLEHEIATYVAHAVPLAPDGSVVLVVSPHAVVAARDAQLVRVEKLATVGVLAAGIAHEVGTPLGVIRGRAEVAGRALPAGHPVRENLQVIIEQIDRISRTIRALLDFARPRRVTACDISVQRPVERVAELVRYEVQKREVHLQVDVPADAPAIHGEPDKVEQLLVNLVMNAIDATPPGGRITISAARLSGHRVAVRVRDTGCGIPAEHLHQVFDPFFTTKAFQRGTGLGLAIVDQIARDHGGIVNLTSSVGRGTTVEVILPAAEADP